MDKLEELLKRQKELDAFIASRRNLTDASDDIYEWTRKKCVALICEMSELLDELNYKWWKDPKFGNRDAVKEEIVDVLHFFLGICNDIDLSADELFDTYLKKNEENHRRQTGESDKSGYKS